ncbi:ras guanine nucleotide exchange factor domain-containing protein [Pilobolus umbonatus]|nr:ras guanine nucleotide exchange factor domain-containing protein [Pilobolus umbonatus]
MEYELINEAIASATDLEEQGLIKDAYFTLTSATQKAVLSLNDIKFIHSAIISNPKQYLTLISSIKSCLTYIENIIDSHSPNKTSIPKQLTGDKPPPPLPPKPSRINKPIIPPKPTRVSSRPPSPNHELQDNSPDIYKNNDTASIKIRPPQSNYDSNTRPTTLPPPRLNAHSITQSTNIPYRPFTEISDVSRDTTIRLVAEGEVDPNHLVPAQTNAGDSLVPSSSTMNNDHVPLIPVPPLLTVHRNLTSALEKFEEKLREYKQLKHSIKNGTPMDNMTEDSIDQGITQYMQNIAHLKATLNSVRTLYMNAATIPTVLQFPAHIIAYQITLIDASIFNAIPPHALLEHSSKKPHPRIVASTDFFNYLTRSVEHSVLLPQEASARAQQIHYWIKVASRCLDVNNYQTLKAIISALSTPPVQRLRRTWAYIPKKSIVKLESLNELMSEENNYGLYREHMGMVSTIVINGKNVAAIRDEHFSKPTIPFLGTFIHDITYLLAAFKSNPNHAHMLPEEEPRIREVLDTMNRFQSGPAYTPTIPQSLIKSTQKHHFRPALSSVLHRGASRIQRIGGGSIFGFDSGNSNNNNNGSSGASIRDSGSTLTSITLSHDSEDEDSSTEEQQKMATQYILMRPWVSQNTVDELSTLREPPQSKSTSLYGRSSNGGSTMNRTSSVMSNASSNVHISTGSVSLNTLSTAGGSGSESRPTSIEDHGNHDDSTLAPNRHRSASNTSQNGFWRFRKSGGEPNTTHRPTTISEGVDKSNIHYPEDQSDYMMMDAGSRNTWSEDHSTNQPSAPVIPPRPPPRIEQSFRADLEQKIARRAESHS